MELTKIFSPIQLQVLLSSDYSNLHLLSEGWEGLYCGGTSLAAEASPNPSTMLTAWVNFPWSPHYSSSSFSIGTQALQCRSSQAPRISVSQKAYITTYTGTSSTMCMAQNDGERRLKECLCRSKTSLSAYSQTLDARDLPLLTHRVEKRRRLEEEDGITIIAGKHLKLIREIGSGPGYLLHAGQNNGHAVIVKVFNGGPTVRQQLEATVALSQEVIHPNLLRIEGISSSASWIHFIAYEDVHWKNAEGPLAVALKNDLERSIKLGFKMIAGLSAGMNHLSAQGVSLGLMRAGNFDIFLDVDDRFVICIHPRLVDEGDIAESQIPEDSAWTVFNTVCQNLLMSANRVLHHEQINRDPAILDIISPNSVSENFVALSAPPSKNTQEDEHGVPPRREYVWRTLNRGRQSLATVARRIALDLDMNLSPLRRFTWTDGRSPHRCRGYVREEITLATTTLDSAVVAHDAPSPLEFCPICQEMVALHEAFDCICGDSVPGSRKYNQVPDVQALES
ncbi:PHD domain-containing protein [Mycena venus]|uniref:PHD domain-containing protein n=1 Tax=Mycena venus TaxID=2733690 RepID=A0A8H7CVN0_9AGAR|nr:PHD domain-containing protein [Mycena venus]